MKWALKLGYKNYKKFTTLYANKKIIYYKINNNGAYIFEKMYS